MGWSLLEASSPQFRLKAQNYQLLQFWNFSDRKRTGIPGHKISTGSSYLPTMGHTSLLVSNVTKAKNHIFLANCLQHTLCTTKIHL